MQLRDRMNALIHRLRGQNGDGEDGPLIEGQATRVIAITSPSVETGVHASESADPVMRARTALREVGKAMRETNAKIAQPNDWREFSETLQACGYTYMLVTEPASTDPSRTIMLGYLCDTQSGDMLPAAVLFPHFALAELTQVLGPHPVFQPKPKAKFVVTEGKDGAESVFLETKDGRIPAGLEPEELPVGTHRFEPFNAGEAGRLVINADGSRIYYDHTKTPLRVAKAATGGGGDTRVASPEPQRLARAG